MSGTLVVAVGAGHDPADWTDFLSAVRNTRVLPVGAAGLSTFVNALRMPLGASGDAVYRAEELQRSLNEGPYVDAAQARAGVVVDLDDLARAGRCMPKS